MPIRSLDQLLQFLDDELRWRKRELTTLKFSIERSRRHEKDMLLRAGICLLYAHWEGFVKASATGYLSYVATRGLRYRDLTPNLVALGLRNDISISGRSNLPSLHTKLTATIMSGLSQRALLRWEDAVHTGSNLKAETLREILSLLGIEFAYYLPKGPIIDKKLLENQNRIAHGERAQIGPEDYNDLHNSIIDLVEYFRTDISNAALRRSYLISPSM